MTDKEKLEEFVKDLNLLLSDNWLYPKQDRGRFLLSINPVFLNNVDEDVECKKVYLFFNENGISHPIYIRTITNEETCYSMVYREILKIAFLSKDSVGRLHDAGTGGSINVLNFQTLLTTGLDKIKEYNDSKK